MILNLPFKSWYGVKEKPVEVILRLGTLEDLCDELGIDFWQIKDFMTKNDFDFSHLLLWHGYKTACEKNCKPVKHGKEKAIIWYEYINATEKKKFVDEMIVLFGKLVKAYKPSDSKKKVKSS